MNYPIWHLFELGGGSLIALVAITHVYVSHLAVGGGMLLWWLDRRAAKENNPVLENFLRRYNWVFLLVTLVFGGISGVGIWWTIALVNPSATSTLIHNFVFGWAIEWVFFLGEIVSLIIYHYYFDRLKRKDRTTMAFFYALFAWLSLVIIDGILSFMLTPGQWLQTGNFWHGFLNPGYFPSMLFRSFACMMMAGLFTFLVGSFSRDSETRAVIGRIGVKWLLIAFVGMLPTGYWYYYSTPADVRFINFGLNAQMQPVFESLLVLSPIILLLALLFIPRTPAAMQRLLAIVLVVIGQFWMASFEYSREIARKPYVIQEFMYSNSILPNQVEELNKAGVLSAAKWSEVHEVAGTNAQKAGEELLALECMSCHTMGGRNDILSQTEKFPYLGMLAQLTGQGKVLGYMPPFVGTDEERSALAQYIVGVLHNKDVETSLPDVPIKVDKNAVVEIPPKSDDYVLLVWNDLGMHCVSDNDEWFNFLPPANTLEAQLIKRGDPPEIVTDDVLLTYEMQEDFRKPSTHLNFWKYAKTIYGADLQPDIGLGGNGTSGEFKVDEGLSSFVAAMIPVSPYRDSDGSYFPYPQATVTALQKSTRDTLAVTKAVVPVSTEIGCRNCHGGDWGVPGGPGLSSETAQNILEAHDRRNGTTLLAEAKAGKPRLCQSCHADPALGASGDSTVLNFSAAMHGWHANYMPIEGSSACQLCHPGNPQGYTRCLRDVHSTQGVGCADCHGSLQEHAMALLKHEEKKPAAQQLMAALAPKVSLSADKVNPRMPWVQEVDCLSCHDGYEQPAHGVKGFNKWNSEFATLFRKRRDEGDAVRCIACHSSTHANYPGANAYIHDWDNVQPLQYQNSPFPIGSNGDCMVCHTVQMEDAIHHENMNRPPRLVLTAK